MPAEFDVQRALEAFRSEMQADRIALQSTIASGFRDLSLALDAHLDDYAATKARMLVVEDRQSVFGRGLWGLFIAFIGVLVPILYHFYADAR